LVLRGARLAVRGGLAAAAGASAFHAAVAGAVSGHDGAAGGAAGGVAHVVELFHGGGGVVEAAVGCLERRDGVCAGTGGQVGSDAVGGRGAVVALEGFA